MVMAAVSATLTNRISAGMCAVCLRASPTPYTCDANQICQSVCWPKRDIWVVRRTLWVFFLRFIHSWVQIFCTKKKRTNISQNLFDFFR